MMKMNTNVGIISSHAAANLYGSGDALSALSTSAGSVGRSIVRMEAAKTSLYDISTANEAAAASPGSASGTTTRQNAPARLQPNTCAASSRSMGTPARTLVVIRTTNGSTSAVCIRATAQTVS